MLLYHVSAVDTTHSAEVGHDHGLSTDTGSMLVQVEEKLEGGQQKKSLVRRVFARFCTPIFLEVLVHFNLSNLCSV